MIRKLWEKIRPTSTEYDPATSATENEIERHQFRHRRRKYKLETSLKNSRKQEKIINQLKLENETLKNEKQKELQAFEDRLGKLEVENRRLEKENKNYENDLKEKEENIHSYEREARAYKNDLREKQNELQVIEERSNTLEVEKQWLEIVNQNYENDLKANEEKIKSYERESQNYKTNLQEKINATEMKNEALLMKLKNDKSTNRKIFMLTLVGISIATSISFRHVGHGHAKELQSFEEQYNTFIKRELLFDGFNKDF